MKTDDQITNPIVLPIAGFPVQAYRTAELVERLVDSHRTGKQLALFFVNSNFVVQCEAIRPQLRRSDVILVNDGVAMDIACRLVHRRTFPDNLNGTDFIPHLLKQSGRQSSRPWKVFLYGGKPGIAERAADALISAGIPVVGNCDGFTADDTKVIEAINASGAEVVLVAKGNPLQEEWILQFKDQLDAGLLLGVGALFDFLAGDKPRAPLLIQKMRVEWLYRLSLEPARLLRRYTIDGAIFLGRSYHYRHSRAIDGLDQ